MGKAGGVDSIGTQFLKNGERQQVRHSAAYLRGWLACPARGEK